MRKVAIAVASIGVLAACLYGYDHFFVQTLTFSDIVDTEGDDTIGTLVVLLDFDTGLTRYDVYRLKAKAAEWDRRIQEIAAMEDGQAKMRATAQLFSEVARDPQVGKIAEKIKIFGVRALGVLLRAIIGYY